MASSKPTHYSDWRNWYIDSGTTDHLCSDRSQFSNLRMLSRPISVYMGDGKPIQATATGTIQLCTGPLHLLQLTNALLVPNIKHNLVAVNRLDKHYKLVFMNGRCYISDKHSRTIAEAQSENNLYRLRLQAPISTTMALTTAKATRPTALPIYHWHERLGHLHEEAIKRLTNIADGMEIAPSNSDVSVCRPCLQGKQHQTFNRTP